MKNLLLSAVFFASTFIGFSQLMRSEVYDFSVGNYYGLEFRANMSGSTTMYTVRYQLFHILSRQLSVTTDSVTYTAQRQTYIPPLPNGSGGATPASYAMDTITFMHQFLNVAYTPEIFDNVFGNTVSHFWDTNTNECYTALDTLIPSPLCLNNSGQANHFGMHLNIMDSCPTIEPYISDYYAYSHAGGPYGGKQNPGDPTVANYLVELFFVVHNGVQCGQLPDFFLNTNENHQLVLHAYPNPVLNELIISGISEIKNCTVLTTEGKSASSQISWKDNVVEVSKLAPGVYFLQLEDNSGKSGMVKFMK
jgi:hypothetical protein